MAEEANLELEAFRKQWQEEVIARAKGSSSGNKNDRAYGSPKRGFGTTQAHQTRLPPASTGPNQFEEGAFDGPDRNEYHDLVDRDVGRRLREEGYGVLPSIHEASHEPGSALEHYEKAVAMESQGNLGDSLKLYRKAYRVRLSTSHSKLLLIQNLSWMLKSIGSTRTNISHPHLPSQNRPTLILPTRQLRCQIPLTIP